MTAINPEEMSYVAPPEPPESRRPPATEVGLIGWLQKNLFSGARDTFVTLVTATVIILFLIEFLTWALVEAQWEVAFLNVQRIMAGNDYPNEEIWRLNIAAYMLIFLCMVLVGFWGRVSRNIVIALAVLSSLFFIIPIASQGVSEPTVTYFVEGSNEARQVNFIASEGDEIEFTLEPLTDASDFGVVNLDSGYIANDNQLSNTSWDLFNNTSALLTRLDDSLANAAETMLAADITAPLGELVNVDDLDGAATEFEALGDAVVAGDLSDEELESLKAQMDILALDMRSVDALTVENVTRDLTTYGRNNDPAVAERALDGFATALRNAGLSEAGNYDLNIAVQVWDADGNVLTESPFTAGSTEDLSFSWEVPADDWYTFTVVFDETSGESGYAFLHIDNAEVFISTPKVTQARIDEYGEPPVLDCNSCGTSLNRTDLRFEGTRTVPQWFSTQATPFLEGIRTFVFIAILTGAVGYLMAFAMRRYLEQNIEGEDEQISPIGVQLITFGWVIAVPIWYVLVKGFGDAGTFPTIPTAAIGGLTLTLILTAVAVIASLPLGILLALGRASDLQLVSFLCAAFIEVFRGVPLITLLFMGRYIVGFVVDGLDEVDLVIRIMIVLTVFTAAYLAEVIRGGLQVVPKGQIEAAQAVGLSGVYVTLFIVLPQALRAVIPAILGQFLSIFKDTSLVFLISLFELTGVTKQLLGDVVFSAFLREAWIFIFITYFVLSYIMASASRRLEETGSGAVRRNQI